MKLELADHLVTPRTLYTHHGLYIGNNKVIEYTKKGVRITDLSRFCEDDDYDKHDFHVQHHPDVYDDIYSFFTEMDKDLFRRDYKSRKYTRKESVKMAQSRLGEDKYNVVFNNCERFVNWCITGLPYCSQIDELLECIEKVYEMFNNGTNVPSNVIEYIRNNQSIISELPSLNSVISNTLKDSSANIELPLLNPIVTTTRPTVISKRTVDGMIEGTVKKLFNLFGG